MNLYILNQSFQTVAVIDQYSSLIWTRRYWNCGDFELYLPANSDLLQYLKIGYYIHREDCDCTMIIEKIDIKTDAENGNYFTVSGRSAESILSYRICMGTGWGTNYPHFLCQVLISGAFDLEQKNTNRYAPEIGEFSGWTDDVGYIIWTGVYENSNLMDVVFSVCMEYGFSYKFVRNENKFDILFYSGSDRTLGQTEKTPVIFSPKYYNLINSEYAYDISSEKTNALVVGGEDETRTVIWHPEGNQAKSGLKRREIYIDAKDLKKKKEDGSYYTADEFYQILAQRGREKIAETVALPTFSGEVDTTLQFIYRRDWDLGDIVTIENEYGMNAKARILEVIEVDDENGYKITPTLSDWEMI